MKETKKIEKLKINIETLKKIKGGNIQNGKIVDRRKRKRTTKKGCPGAGLY